MNVHTIAAFYWLWVIFLMACTTAFGDNRTQAAPLKKGVLLVANRQLGETSFRHAVILITRYSAAQGAMGITVNRVTHIPLQQFVPDAEPVRPSDALLFTGGPVQPGALIILVQSSQGHGLEKVFDNIHFGNGLVQLSRILELKSEHDLVRAYSGYTGWFAGQLENEIRRGDWIIVPGNADLIFQEQPKKLWYTLMQHWAGTWL